MMPELVTINNHRRTDPNVQAIRGGTRYLWRNLLRK
jgi:hypothetical protein